ncbi:TPA: hypothetical protein ACPSKB_002574 [Legionella feeleii]
MPLTKAQAVRLNQARGSVDLSESINVAKDAWDNAMRHHEWRVSGAQDPHAALQNELIGWRKASLNRRSVLVDFDVNGDGRNKKVRVFPPSDKNIDNDVNDIFARGLDSARAVTEILRCHPQKGLDNKALKDLTKLLNKFQENMNVHLANEDDAKGMENARKELARFNGALANLLVHNAVVTKRGEAIQAINFVRDFLWKKDICTANCVIEKNGKHGQSEILRYAEPMEFGKAEVKRIGSATNEPINFWDGAQPWKTKLAQAVGGGGKGAGWFEHFMGDNLETMKKLSSTPMSRFTPNPANAFDCSDITIDKDGVVTHISSHERTAVTEPLNVGGTNSRQDVTDWNHLQLMSKARLKSGLTSFMEKWGPFIDANEPIPFTVLHQTLIGDEVTFSPDQSKAKASKLQASVIDSKAEANAAVRQMLESSTILRERATGEIKFLSNADFAKQPYNGQIPDGWQKVNVDLLETNNGINMWGARTRVRNNDYNDARQLIGNAVNVLNKVDTKYPNQDLKTVIDFLNSRDHSLVTPFKFRGKEVKDAVQRLSGALRNGDDPFSNLDKDVRENLALSVQAAVELKCTVHETWLGSARRNIDNFTRDYVRQVPILGHLVDWAVRGAMTVAALGLKAVAGILTFPVSLPQWFKHRGDRREMYKSTYEGLLAESLGSLKGGCMSSADRAGEQGDQRAMMKKQFAEEGKIISYNDSPTEKARVYGEYGSTKAKHDFVEMATGTPGTSDDETRGIFLNARDGVLSYVAETAEEQQLAKDLSGLRKGKYSDVTAQQYMTTPAVGVKVQKVEKQKVSSMGEGITRPLLDVEESVEEQRVDIRVGVKSKDDSHEPVVVTDNFTM